MRRTIGKLATAMIGGFLWYCVSVYGGSYEADWIAGTNPAATNFFKGKVGIGTTNPVSTLHVAGDMTVTGPMKVPKQGDVSMGSYTSGESAGGVSGGGCVWFTNAAGDVYIMTKVGIGTNSPATTLHVVGDATVTGNATVGSNLNVNGGITAHGTFDAGTNRISNLLDPSNNQDAATKGWVNSHYVSTETDPVFNGWLGANTYVKTETDPAWAAVSNQYAKTNAVVLKVLAGTGISLSPSGGQGQVTINASVSGLTNTVGANSYTNTGFNLQPGSNVTLRSQNGTNFIDGGIAHTYTQVSLDTNWTRSGTAWTTAPSNSANAVDNDPETQWGDAKIAASGETVVYWDLGSVMTGKIVMVADAYNSGGNNTSIGLCYSYDNVTAVSNTTYAGYYISGNNYGLRFVSAATSWAGSSKQPLVVGFEGRYVGAILMAGSAGNSYFRMHEFQVWKEN